MTALATPKTRVAIYDLTTHQLVTIRVYGKILEPIRSTGTVARYGVKYTGTNVCPYWLMLVLCHIPSNPFIL